MEIIISAHTSSRTEKMNILQIFPLQRDLHGKTLNYKKKKKKKMQQKTDIYYVKAREWNRLWSKNNQLSDKTSQEDERNL